MPSLFGSSEDFQRWFGVECHLDEEEVLLVTSRLHQILRPFMLRRLKETVASELPDKVRLNTVSHKHCWRHVEKLLCKLP